MDTDQEEFYEDTCLMLGHLVAELSQLLASLDEQKFHHSIIEVLKLQVFHHRAAIIEKLRTAEESIRDVRAMIDQ